MQDNIARVISEMEEALGQRLRQMEQALQDKEDKIMEMQQAVHAALLQKQKLQRQKNNNNNRSY